MPPIRVINGYDSAVAREYDGQLLESVATRRGRLRESLLWGRLRRRRATADNLRRFAVSIVIAALACAGCVSWSFVQQALGFHHQQSNFPTKVGQ